MSKVEIRQLGWMICQQGAATYDESTTRIYIDDEAAGEFVVIEQDIGYNEPSKVAFARDEIGSLIVVLSSIRDEIDRHASLQPDPSVIHATKNE